MADSDPAALNSVEDDLLKLAQHFKDKYESIEEAKKQFDPDVEFTYYSFEAALKTWRVTVADAAELFEFIDLDMSGQITFHELFHALEQPLEDIKVREKVRQEREVSRIYEELAENIRERFGSVEEMFKNRQFLQHDEEEGDFISLAGFRRLVTQLGVDLAASQLTRVFNEIDKNRSGKVSKNELQDALQYNLVRGYLVDLANFMTARDDSVAKTFELEGEAMMRRSSVASTPTSMSGKVTLPASAVSSAASMESPPPLGTMGQEEFVRLLRRMKVLEHVTEPTAHFLLSALRLKNAEDFKAHLERVHAEDLVDKKYEKERRDRIEQENKRKLKAASAYDQPKMAENDVVDWLKRMEEAGTRPVRVEDLTRQWEVAARAGGSHTQMQDYVKALEQKLKEREDTLCNLREEVESLRAEMPADLSPSDRSSPAMSPLMRVKTPLMGVLDLTLRQKNAAKKAEKLIQAAASGDVAGVQRLLQQRADVNVVGWGGVTPLMAAARHGRPTVLRCLCERRADLTRTDAYGRTAVDHAARSAVARDWLRCQGGMTGSELKAEAEMLAQRMLEVQAEWTRLEEYKTKLPSRELLRRTVSNRRKMERGGSMGGATPPGASPLLSPEASPRDLLRNFLPGGRSPAFVVQDTPSFTIGGFENILKPPRP